MENHERDGGRRNESIEISLWDVLIFSIFRSSSLFLSYILSLSPYIKIFDKCAALFSH